MNATTSSAREGAAGSAFGEHPRYGHAHHRRSTGQRAMRHDAQSLLSSTRDSTDFSFSKCYPCSRLTLSPIFPVAHMELDCLRRVRVEPKHAVEAVRVLGRFRLLGQLAWSTPHDIVDDHNQRASHLLRAVRTVRCFLAISRWTSNGPICATQPPAPACQSLSSPSTLPWTLTWTIDRKSHV